MNVTILTVVINLIGLFLFLFTFFRRMKEDYASDLIFTTAFYMLAGLGVGYALSRIFLPYWWFWLIVSGFSLGLMIGIFRFHLRFFETLESSFASILPWLAFVFLVDSVNNSSLYSFLAFVSLLGILTLFYFLESIYKNFTWYTSGRVGFSGMASVAAFFLLRGTIAYFFPFVLSFVGRYDAVISGIIAFFAFYGLYNLSRS